MVGLLLSSLLLAACARNLGARASGWGPIAVTDGTVYVGTRQGEVRALIDRGLEGLPAAKWTSPFPPQGSGERLFGVFGSPLLAGDLLYVSAVNGRLYAIDKSSGTVGGAGWRSPLTSRDQPEPMVAGPALDPATKTVVAGSEDGNLYAYNALTGEPLSWSPFRTGDKIWSTPVVRDGIVYFGSHDRNVYAVSLKDGKELWRFSTGGSVVTSPLLMGNTVVVGSYDKKLYGINIADGKPLWQFEASNWFWASPVSDGKAIFAGSMDGKVYALDPNGRMVWSHDMGTPIVSTPVLTSRGLVVAGKGKGGKNGKLTLLDPSIRGDGGGRERGVFFLKTEIKAPLVAAGDSVYVGAVDSTVRRFDVKVGTLAQIWCFHTKNTQCK